MPETGQFVRVWCYDARIWSSTFKWIGRELHVYDDTDDRFINTTVEFVTDATAQTDIHYIILGED